MSDKPEALLIDAGNTNVKYCFADKAGGLTLLPEFDFDVPGILGLNNIRRVLLCSVRSADYAEEVKSKCASESVDLTQIFTTAEAFGTRCAYANFSTLGVDRWMNILAVAKETDEAVLSFSIGTAMTIDLVYRRQHLGGWITPGFDLAKQALFSNTNGVFGDQEYPTQDKFGESTQDCVNFGCRALVNGLLREGLRQASRYSEQVKIKVFGGGVRLLDIGGFDNIEVDNLLVFKGLSRFIQGDFSQK